MSMRKKVLSLVLSAGMLIGMVPNSVMADTAFQSEGPVPAEQTEEEKTVEAAEKAALAFATLPAEKEEDGKTSRLIVSVKSGDMDGKILGTDSYVDYDGLIVAQYESVKTAEGYKAKLESLDGVEAVEYDQAMALSDDTAFTADPVDSASESDASSDTDTSGEQDKDSVPNTDPNTGAESEADAKSGNESVSSSSSAEKSDSRYLFEEAREDGKKVIAIIDSGAPESLVKKQSWLIDESEDKNKKETGEDRNGHGTEMVQIISNLSQDSSYLYSIKAFDKDGNGYLSSVLMALKLAKAEQADLINISANTKVKADSAILQTVIRDVAKESQIVVSAGNNADDAVGYLPAGMDSVVTAGACDTDGYLTDTSNYGAKVNYYVTTDSTSKAAATVTGYLSAGNTFGDEVKTSAEKRPTSETENKETASSSPSGNASGSSSVSSSSGTQPQEDGSSDSGAGSKARPFSAVRRAPKLNANEANPSDDRVITAEFKDTPNKVIIKKVDKNGKLLDGGEFTFTDPNGKKIVKTTATGTDIDASMQGAVVLEGLIPGTWTYQETKAPDGYLVDNNVYTLTVTHDGLINGQTEYIDQIVNNKRDKDWYVRIKKQDTTGTTVTGVVFEITDSENGTYKRTTNKDGIVATNVFPWNKSVNISYREVSVPADSGIILDPSVHTITAKNGVVTSTGNSTILVTDKTNQFRIRKTGTNGKALQGVLFTLTGVDASGKTIYDKRLITGEDGKTDIVSRLQAGTYTYQEISVPAGYKLDTTAHTFTVDQNFYIHLKQNGNESIYPSTTLGDVAVATVTNTRNGFRIRKTVSDGSSRKGFPFRVWSESKNAFTTGKNDTETPASSMTLTTDDNGYIDLAGLAPDTYYYQEQPHDGYVIDSRVHGFTIDTDGNISATFYLTTTTGSDGKAVEGKTKETAAGSGTEADPASVTISNTPNRFTLKKVDENGSALSGVTFRFTYAGTGTNPFAGGSDKTTDGSGQITFTKMPAGKYTFTEIKPKDNTWIADESGSDPYSQTGKIYSFDVQTNGTISTSDTSLKIDGNGTGDMTVTRTNRKHKTFGLQITKTDKTDGSKLSGASFDLMENVSTTAVPSYKKVGTLADNGKGVYELKNIQITNDNKGRFSLVETKAPDGYVIGSEYAAPGKTFTVTDEQADGSYTMQMSVEDTPVTVQFVKKDKEGNKLPDAVFRVWKQGDAAHGSFARGIEVKSDADGIVKLTRYTLGVPLSKGTWYYQESKAPAGFDLDTNAYSFTVTDTGVNNNAAATLPDVVDTPTRTYPVQIVLTKTNTAKETLDGAAFTVQQWSRTKNAYVDATTLAQRADKKYQSVSELYITDDNQGKFRVIETKAPEGYSPVDPSTGKNWQYDFTVTKTEQASASQSVAQNIVKEINAVNYPTEIKVHKVDQADKPLAGAVFTLTRGSDGAGDYIHNGTYPDSYTATSGADGYAVFEKIYPGSYTLEETSAPEGYAKDTTTYNIVVDENGYINFKGGTNKQREVDITMKNLSNELVITKVDGDNHLARLAGIPFSIWYGTDTAHAVTETTDKNGEIHKTALKAGPWHFRELKDKNGNDISRTSQIHSITVYRDGRMYRSEGMEEKQELNVTVLNGADQQGTVRIRKIKAGTDPSNKANWITDAVFTVTELNVQTQQFETRNDMRFAWNAASGYYELQQDKNYQENPTSIKNPNWQTAPLTWTKANGGQWMIAEAAAGSVYRSDNWKSYIDLTEKMNWTYDLYSKGGKIISGKTGDENIVENKENHLTLKKVDAVTGKAVPNFGFTITNPDDAADVHHVTTGADGTAELTGKLKNGVTYFIKEDPAIDKNKTYHMEEHQDTLAVGTDGSMNGEMDYVYTAYDYSHAAKVVIQKLSTEDTNKRLKNTKFAVYQWNKNLNNGKGSYEPTPYREPVWSMGELTHKDVDWTYDETTGQYTGRWLKKDDTNLGKFLIREIQNEQGYTGSWSAEITIDDKGGTDQTFTFNLNNQKAVYNEPVGILHTGASDNETDSSVQIPDDEASITDRVYFHNLDAGRTYTIKGWIMDQDENKEYTDTDGNKSQAYVTFTISSDGKSLTVDGDTAYTYSLRGGKAIAGLTYKQGENWQLGEYKDRKYTEDGLTEGSVRKTDNSSAYGNITPLGVVDGWIDVPFYMNSSDQGGTNLVVYEELYSPTRNYKSDGSVYYTDDDGHEVYIGKGGHLVYRDENADGSYKKDANGNYVEIPMDGYGKLQADHKNLNDDDQTINIIVPELHTTLGDITTASDHEKAQSAGYSKDSERGGTWDHIGKVYDKEVLRDTVGVIGLSGKNTYFLKGTLVYKEDYTDSKGTTHKAGETVKDASGKEVTISRVEVRDPKTGALYTGSYGNSTVLPQTKTVAKTNGETVTGVAFTPTEGTLVHENGEYLDDAGNHVTGITKKVLNYFNVEFDLDSTNLENAKVVAQETLYVVRKSGEVIALTTHDQLEDAKQSVYYQTIRTSAADSSKTGSKVRSGNQTDKEVARRNGKDVIWDTVTIKNLKLGNIKMEEQTNEKGNPIYQKGTAAGVKIDGSSTYDKYPVVDITAEGNSKYQVHGVLMSRTQKTPILVKGKRIETTVSLELATVTTTGTLTDAQAKSLVTVTGTTSVNAPEIVSVTAHYSDTLMAIDTKDENGKVYKKADENGRLKPTKKTATINLPETVDLVIRIPVEIDDVQYLEGQKTVVFEDLLHTNTTYDSTVKADYGKETTHTVAYHRDYNDDFQTIFFQMFTDTLFTGGPGVKLFYLTDIGLIAAVTAWLVYRRKKKKALRKAEEK